MDSSHQQVVPYDSNWPNLYEEEVKKLKPIFSESLVDIEHIGSTSVPGLSSKPIIDIAVLIKSHTEADQFIEPLEKLGYKFDKLLHDKIKFPERHFFRKGDPSQFHVSIAYADKGSFWKRQLAFRDYLRSHPEERDKYGELKQRLIQEDPTGKNGYIEGKTNLINEMLDRSGFVRWKPTK